MQASKKPKHSASSSGHSPMSASNAAAVQSRRIQCAIPMPSAERRPVASGHRTPSACPGKLCIRHALPKIKACHFGWGSWACCVLSRFHPWTWSTVFRFSGFSGFPVFKKKPSTRRHRSVNLKHTTCTGFSPAKLLRCWFPTRMPGYSS